MNILLDTHIAIWALIDSPKLTRKARDLIIDPDNTIYYSVVSVWEVMLKHAVHPESIDLTAEVFSAACNEAGFVSLELKEKHVLEAETVNAPQVADHKDPFDRMLLAQAKAEKMSLLTNDRILPLYGEKCVICQ